MKMRPQRGRIIEDLGDGPGELRVEGDGVFAHEVVADALDDDGVELRRVLPRVVEPGGELVRVDGHDGGMDLAQYRSRVVGPAPLQDCDRGLGRKGEDVAEHLLREGRITLLGEEVLLAKSPDR